MLKWSLAWGCLGCFASGVPAEVLVLRQGLNGYDQAADARLRLSQPNTNFGDTIPLAVDFPNEGGNTHDQVLLRFGGLSSRLPNGAKVISAKLKLFTGGNNNAPGQGARLHRMRQPWESGTATWNLFGAGLLAGTHFEGEPSAQIGALRFNTSAEGAGTAHVGNGPVVVDVTSDVRAFVEAGAENHGWALVPFDRGTNAWLFVSSEALTEGQRPTLIIEYDAAPTWQQVTTLTEAQDVTLSEAEPEKNQGANDRALVDFPSSDSGKASHSLIRFDPIFGEGRVPEDAVIVKAVFSLQAYGPAATGDGGQLFRLLQPWNELESTWANAFGGNGVQSDDQEAAAQPTASLGSPSLEPNVDWGQQDLDVTEDVRRWQAGTPNHGWALLPWPKGSDALIFVMQNHPDRWIRPRLTIFWARKASFRR